MHPAPKHPELAGTCREAVQRLCREDPSLTAVAGWYDCPFWGPREHCWATDAQGRIIDPTVSQFPLGGAFGDAPYREHDGTHPCPGCGAEVVDAGTSDGAGFCCGTCYASTIGMLSHVRNPVPCTC